MKRLIIAIDPGFDTMKVVANGILFKFPFNVIETDERKMSDYLIRDDFMLYRDPAGGSYRVGECAREMLYDNKTQMDDFYTEDRFTSDEFKIGLNTAIAMAIDKNGLHDEQDNLDIHLIVALPHGCRYKYEAAIKGNAYGRKKFSLRCGKPRAQDYDFVVPEDQVSIISQTIAAMLGETSDDDGYVNEQFELVENGPTLVLDGGYYTMGMVVISRSGNVNDDYAESDTHHAMANVNKLVAGVVKEHRPDINHYSVEYLLKKNDGRIRYIDNGRAVTLDLKELQQEKLKEVCDDLIDYLNRKYNSLLDFEYVIVTGGTGARFYQQLFDYYTGSGLIEPDHFLLTTCPLNGTTNSIEYAIAIGAYKGIKSVIRAQDPDADE